VLSTNQFLDTQSLQDLFRLASILEYKDKMNALAPSLQGKLLATVFYEPSTRTKFSFEAAMHKLGGNVLGTEHAGQFSSAIKGETLQDSIKIIGGYADVIVMRHFQEGSAKLAAEVSDVPIINAGDGIGEHPTQALLDIYTIYKEKGSLDNLRIAMIGDLLNGRTIHSLLNVLSLYKNTHLYLIAPKQLGLPEKYKKILKAKRVKFEEGTDFKPILSKIDVLYVTRVQKERFANQEEYEKLKHFYMVDKEVLKKMNPKAIIMHPLPRVGEISTEVDQDPRAAYFRQAKNGLYIRMALLHMIFNGETNAPLFPF